MGRYDKKNEEAVDRGLKWLTARRDVILEEGMRRLLITASAYAIAQHDHTHFGHRITENSHGWALVKDGKILGIGVNEGHHGEGDAERQLQTVAGGISKNGYVGIILASMTATRDNGRPIMFEIEFEMDIMKITADEIRDNFSTYFKPIK